MGACAWWHGVGREYCSGLYPESGSYLSRTGTRAAQHVQGIDSYLAQFDMTPGTPMAVGSILAASSTAARLVLAALLEGGTKLT